MNTDNTAIATTVPVTPAGAFRFSFYVNRYDNKPDPSAETSFEAFATALVASGHRRGPKDGLAFSPAVFRPGTTRALDNVEVVTAVGLDLEHVTPARMAEVRRSLKAFAHILYSTWSHTPEEPRYRAIIELERELPASLHPQLWALVADMVGTDVCDPATKDASRLFYLPAAPEGAPVELEYHPADGVNVFAIDPLVALGLTKTQYAEAMARSTAPSLAPPPPPVSIADGLVEKKGALSLKPRPTAADLKARVMSCSPNQWRPNIERLFRDEPFADAGGRDAAAHGCASTIAWVAPEAEVEDIAQLFEKSVEAMWKGSTSASNPPPNMDQVRAKIRRAINARREKYYEEQAIFGNSTLGAAVGAHSSHRISLAPLPSDVTEAAPTPSPKMFHGVAGEIVRTIGPHTEASWVAILLQLLVAIAAIFGRGPHFRVEATDHFCNENLVIIGKSSKARKGTSLGWVLRLLRFVAPDWFMNCIEQNAGSGEGLVHRIRDPIMKFDKEAMQEVEVDPGVSDKRLLVRESEFANTLNMTARDGNILSATLRAAWDGENLGTLTKSSPTKATEPYVSFIGHITGSEFRRLLNATESANGFGNRFVFIYAERSQLLPEGGALTDDDLLPFVVRLQEIVAFARSTGRMKRDAAARQRWIEVYPKLSEGEDSLVGSLTSRSEAHVTRFAMIYALLDRSTEVRVEHLDAALALWDYAYASCHLIFGDQLGDPIADVLLAALRQQPEGLSRTAISRVVLGGHKKATEINRALLELQRRGLVTSETVATNGRPGELWRAVINTQGNSFKGGF